MLVTCSELHVCSYPSYLCRQLGNYETCSINLVTMNARNLHYSYLYVPQSYIAVSFNKCTLCKSLWIKASAKCPKCKCKLLLKRDKLDRRLVCSAVLSNVNGQLQALGPGVGGAGNSFPTVTGYQGWARDSGGWGGL